MIRRASTALAALAVLGLLAGCGGDKKTIPRDEGASLIRLLRQARDQAGDTAKCPQLAITVQRIQSRVVALPASVDKNTRESLTNGVNNLIDNVRSECAGAQTTTTTTPDTTPTTPPTTQETTPPPTPQTTPPPTQTTPPNTQTQPGNGGTGPGNGGQSAPGQQKKDGKGPGGKGAGNEKKGPK